MNASSLANKSDRTVAPSVGAVEWFRNPRAAVSHAYAKGPGTGDGALCGQPLEPGGVVYGFENDVRCNRCSRALPDFKTVAKLDRLSEKDRLVLAFISNGANRHSDGVSRRELSDAGLSWRRAERLIDTSSMVWTTEEVVSDDDMPERTGVIYHADAVVSRLLRDTYAAWVN